MPTLPADLADLIAEACTHPVSPSPRCVCCGHLADPGVRGDEGWACAPCAEMLPALAMTTDPTSGPARRVYIGDALVGTLTLRTSGWIASARGRYECCDGIDAALDRIAVAWGWRQ